MGTQFNPQHITFVQFKLVGKKKKGSNLNPENERGALKSVGDVDVKREHTTGPGGNSLANRSLCQQETPPHLRLRGNSELL